MKAVVCSDLHVNAHRVGSVDAHGRDRLDDGLSAFDQTLAFAREHQAMWFFLGDLKTPKSVWPLAALNGVRAVLGKYGDVVKVALPGNHDTVADHGGSGLDPLREFMTVYDRPTLDPFPGEGKGRGLVALAAWPWGTGHRDELPAFLDEAAAARGRGEIVVLLAHLMFAGVLLGSAGDVAPDKGLPVDMFRPADAVDLMLVGDVHKGQMFVAGPRGGRMWQTYADVVVEVGSRHVKGSRRVGEGKRALLGAGVAIPLRTPRPWSGETLYPGSPYMQSWGESGDWPKGALLVDFATGAVDLLPVRAPRFWAVEIGEIDEIGAPGFAKVWSEGDVVRLIVPASELAKKGATAKIQMLARETRVRSLTPIPRRDAAVVQRTPVHGGMTPEELVREYVKARPLDGLDASVLARAGVELLVERDEGDSRVA